MRDLLKAIGLCFITAVFIVCIVITLFLLTESVYTLGRDDEAKNCQEQFKTGEILPQGVMELTYQYFVVRH